LNCEWIKGESRSDLPSILPSRKWGTDELLTRDTGYCPAL